MAPCLEPQLPNSLTTPGDFRALDSPGEFDIGSSLWPSGEVCGELIGILFCCDLEGDDGDPCKDTTGRTKASSLLELFTGTLPDAEGS